MSNEIMTLIGAAQRGANRFRLMSGLIPVSLQDNHCERVAMTTGRHRFAERRPPLYTSITRSSKRFAAMPAQSKRRRSNPLVVSDIATGETTFSHGEIRVLDLDIGVALGYRRDRTIRDLIRSNLTPLERLGGGHVERRVIEYTSGKGRTETTEEFFLNRDQALYIAMLSPMPNAMELRIGLIEFYSFWEKALRMSSDEQRQAVKRARRQQANTAARAAVLRARGEKLKAFANGLLEEAALAEKALPALTSLAGNFEKLEAFRPSPAGPIHPFAVDLVEHSTAAAVYWVLCEQDGSSAKKSDLCALLQERFDIAIDLSDGELQLAFDELGYDRLIEFNVISNDAFTETKTDWTVYLRSPHHEDRLLLQYGREARLLIRILREQGLEPGVDNWRTINVAYDSQFFVRPSDSTGAIGLVKAISYGAAAGRLEFDDGRVRLTTAEECEAICVENRPPAVRLSGPGATGSFRIARVERPFVHLMTHPALDEPNDLWPDDLGMPPVRLTRKMVMLISPRNRGCGYRYNDEESDAQLPDLLSHPDYDCVPRYRPIFLPPKTEPSA